MKIPISQLIIAADSSIEDALINLNNSALGICFICDEQNILIGTITDGDIRRKLLTEAIFPTMLYLQRTQILLLNL